MLLRFIFINKSRLVDIVYNKVKISVIVQVCIYGSIAV